MTKTKTLVIDIRSAEGLKLNRKPVKRKTFAVARIGDKIRKWGLDESGGNNPTWNYKSEVLIDVCNVQFILVEIFYRTSSGHERKICEAKIPAEDFMGKYSPEGHLSFLSYRLRDEFGDKCGIVNVSIMVKPISTESKSSCSSSSMPDESKHTAAIDGYGGRSTENGLWRPRTEPPEIGGYGGRVVTGVPIWCVIQRRPS